MRVRKVGLSVLSDSALTSPGCSSNQVTSSSRSGDASTSTTSPGAMSSYSSEYYPDITGKKTRLCLRTCPWLFHAPGVIYCSFCCRCPSDHKEDFVKRLIALPGEWIRIPASAEIIKIPEGHCWVEGDNAARSWDSRSFGPVSYFISIFFSTYRTTLLWLLEKTILLSLVVWVKHINASAVIV